MLPQFTRNDVHLYVGMLKSTDVSMNPYVFSLTITGITSGLSTVATQVVTVTTGAIPIVSIVSAVTSGTTVSVSRPVFAVGLAYEPLNSSRLIDMSQGLFLCQWQCTSGDFDMTSGNPNLFSDPASMALSIAANALVPGRTYAFTLNVWSIDLGVSLPSLSCGRATVSFRVASFAPSGGTCSCTPAQGDTNTIFLLSCSYWQASTLLGQASLLYSYATLFPDNVVIPLSAAYSQQPSLSVQLPASSGSSNTTLIASICDPSMSCTSVSFQAYVTAAPLNVALVTQQISSIVASADRSSLLVSATSYSSATGSTSEKETVSSALLQAVVTVGNSSTLDSSDSVGMLVLLNFFI